MMSGLPIALLVTMVVLVTGQTTHVNTTESNPPTSAITNPSKTSMSQANSMLLGITSGGTKLLITTVSPSPSTTSSHDLATSTDSIVLSKLSLLSQEIPASPSISVTKSSSYDSKTSLLKQRSLSMLVRSSPVNSIMASMLSSVHSSSIQTLSMELRITPSINPPANNSSTEPISSKLDVKSMSSVDSHVTSQASNTTLTTRSKTNNASVSVNATSTSVFIPTTTVTSDSSIVNTTLIMETASMFITLTSMANPSKRSFHVVSTTVFSKDVVNSTLTSFVNMVKPTATSSVFKSSVMLVRNTTVMPLPTANVTSAVTMVTSAVTMVTSDMVKATRMGNTTMTSLAIVNATITPSQVNVTVNATVTTTTANDMMSVASLAGRTSVTLIPMLSIKTTTATVAIETTTMRSVTAVTTSVRSRASSSVKAFFRTNSSSLTSQLRTSSLILPISTSAITSHSSKLMSKPSTSKPPSLSSSTTVIPQMVSQKFRLTIEGNCTEVQNDNSNAFKTAVKTSISTTLGIDRSQIKVLSIVCGSIIVDIEIKSVPKDNVTKRFTEAVNKKQIKIDYMGKLLAVTSVSTITAKPRDDDDNTAFIIYIVLGTVMGVAFLIAVVALIIRCQRERSAGMFHLPNEEHLELSGFSRNNKSHVHQGNFYGDLEMESGDPGSRARSSEPDIVPYGDDTMNGGTDVTPNVGYLPEWKSLTKLDLSEAGHAGDESASGNNLLLTYANKNTEKESEVVGSDDSFRSYDNPSVE